MMNQIPIAKLAKEKTIVTNRDVKKERTLEKFVISVLPDTLVNANLSGKLRIEFILCSNILMS